MKKFIRNIIVLSLIAINLGLVLHMDINGVQSLMLAIFLGNSLILANFCNNNPRALFLGLISATGLSICPIGQFTIQVVIFTILLGISLTALMMPRSKKKVTKKRVHTLKEVA